MKFSKNIVFVKSMAIVRSDKIFTILKNFAPQHFWREV